MTGMPSAALNVYDAAIDALKSANDLLWLAGVLKNKHGIKVIKSTSSDL